MFISYSGVTDDADTSRTARNVSRSLLGTTPLPGVAKSALATQFILQVKPTPLDWFLVRSRRTAFKYNYILEQSM